MINLFYQNTNGMVNFKMFDLPEEIYDSYSEGTDLSETDIAIFSIQNLLLEADDPCTLKIAFSQICEYINKDDIDSSSMIDFINSVRTVIKNHCCNIARNFEEKVAVSIEEECESMLWWLNFVTNLIQY